MRHIKKFNESTNIDKIEDLINDVFIDFFDNHNLDYDHDEDTNEYFLSFDINTMFENTDEADANSSSSLVLESESVNRFISYHSKILDTFKNIDVCIERLKKSINIKSYLIEHHDGESLDGKILSYINISIQI